MTIEIWQIIYSLYRAKEITKRAYNNIMSIIKPKYKVGTIYMNSENSKTSDFHKLLLNLLEKINLNRTDKNTALSNLIIHYTSKSIKPHTKTTKLKYQLQYGIKNLNYPMVHVLYQICKIISSLYLKNLIHRLLIIQ